MAGFRRLLVLAAVAAGSTLLAAPALAARPTPAELPFTVSSTHFAVHYQSDPTTNFAITQTEAGDLAAMAERAYAAELADGYAAPLSDGALGGDARTDVYVVDLSSFGALGFTIPDNPGARQTSAYIELSAEKSTFGLDQLTVAHELFHVLQLSVWYPAQLSDFWLLEGSAEWMGYRVNGYSGSLDLGPSDMSLDCRDPRGTAQCDLSDVYKNNGYSRWPFFEFLSEKYGTSFVKDVLASGAAGAPTAIAALSNALVAKGTTLADTYDSWVLTELTAGYSVKALQGLTPPVAGTIETKDVSGPLPTSKITLNHLSTRYLRFDRGTNDTTTACYAATLSLTVTMPAGTQSKPAFFWDEKGSSPIQLSVSGNTAIASIPWDTCTWAANKGLLAIPNASQNVDGADFVVSASLTVDRTQPATASPPPDPLTVNTPVLPVPTASDVAPTVTIAGAEVLRLSATDKEIRLIVESSGDGTLHAMLGGVDLGSPTLRAGNNDVHLALPASMRSQLRRSAADDVLTLTAVSPQGTQTGASVTRRVVIAQAQPKAKPKPKQPKPRK